MADGSGVLVAILDSGITLGRRIFQKENGESRFVSVWDQTVPYDPETAANRYKLGRIYDSGEINQAVSGRRDLARDVNGHGTRVAGIIAENAPGAELIMIKLDSGNREGFAKLTSIMYAVDFCVRYASEQGMPLVINLSYGNNNGGHDGKAILETFLDDVAVNYLVSIVVATGNEGDKGHHRQVDTTRREEVGILMGENERNLTMSVWFSFQDQCRITLTSPGGESLTVMPGFDLVVLDNTRVAVFYGEPTPFNMTRELRFRWLDSAASSGLWTLAFEPQEIRWGIANIWLPVSEGLAGDTRFTEPTVDTTLTIPSTADRVISVGAFDSRRKTLAAFSGRGYTADGRIKPDVVAPGVDVPAITQTGSALSTGTSFAAPFISARAAVLMDWGIVQGNDPFLYGEKLKAYIIREARPLPVLREYPNPAVGWGAVSQN
ncbi:MAG: S8 family peptidase [Lachnospiraceae bacterium]